MSSRIRKAGMVLVCGILVGALLSGTAFGQAQDGNLVGTILDPTGASVPNARVEIENLATGIKTATTADSTGFYRFNNLLIGIYKIAASAEGLAQSAREVTIQLNKTATANVTLAVAGIVQEIPPVFDSPELIDTTT